MIKKQTPKSYEVKMSAEGLRFGIVVSRWNAFITERLLQGSLDTLISHGARESDIEVTRVPGAWEIPVATKRLAVTGRFNAIICLGCVIRGETPHFEYLSAEVTRGLGSIALETCLPITYGILTVENVDQATARAGAKPDNKGAEAAMAAIEMADLMRQLG